MFLTLLFCYPGPIMIFLYTRLTGYVLYITESGGRNYYYSRFSSIVPLWENRRCTDRVLRRLDNKSARKDDSAQVLWWTRRGKP